MNDLRLPQGVGSRSSLLGENLLEFSAAQYPQYRYREIRRCGATEAH